MTAHLYGVTEPGLLLVLFILKNGLLLLGLIFSAYFALLFLKQNDDIEVTLGLVGKPVCRLGLESPWKS